MDINKKEFLEALRKTMGNVSKACEKVGVSRQTFYNWKENDPEFLDGCLNVKASAIDMTESALLKQITEGNTTAIIFYLKTQAKDRGYGDQTQIEHSGGIAIERAPTRATVKITGKMAGE